MKVISKLKNLPVRQILTVFLVVLTVFVMQAFGGNALQAQADDDTVQSSQGIYYKVTPDRGEVRTDNTNNEIFHKTKQNLKETADSVKKNLKVDNLTTPEATDYKAPGKVTLNNEQKPVEEAKNGFKKLGETITEKLNLNEEPPRSTKEFLNKTEKTVEKTVEPVTGTHKGYYNN